jgi:hypothetical protein
MSAISFPDPSATNPVTGAPYGDGWYNEQNGVTYTYANNVWSAVTEPNTSLDARYVEVAGDDMTGNLTLGTDKITLDATAGLGEFKGGVKVAGGSLAGVETGIYQIGDNLDICFNGNEVAQFFDNGAGIKCWTFGAPQDPNIGFNVRSSPAVYQPTGAATQTGNQFRTYVAANAKRVSNVASSISLDEATVLDNYTLFTGNLTTEAGKGPLSEATVYYAGSTSNTANYAATNNYGFYSEIYGSVVGNNNFNFYAAGNAPNYFEGEINVQRNKGLRIGPYGAQKDDVTIIKQPWEDDWTTDQTHDVLTAVTSGIVHSRLCFFNGSNDVGATLLLNNRHATSNSTVFASFRENGSVIGSIQSDGSGGIVINGTSDYRIKENITPLSPAADKIKALKPCNYNFIGRTKIATGFIAHELQEVLPEAVTGTKDATQAIGTLADYDGTVLETAVTEPSAEELEYTEEVETDGVATMVTRTKTWSPTGTRPVYQGVDQTKLIPLLTKALQEALTTIDDLQARLAVLEAA